MANKNNQEMIENLIVIDLVKLDNFLLENETITQEERERVLEILDLYLNKGDLD